MELRLGHHDPAHRRRALQPGAARPTPTWSRSGPGSWCSSRRTSRRRGPRACGSQLPGGAAAGDVFALAFAVHDAALRRHDAPAACSAPTARAPRGSLTRLDDAAAGRSALDGPDHATSRSTGPTRPSARSTWRSGAWATAAGSGGSTGRGGRRAAARRAANDLLDVEHNALVVDRRHPTTSTSAPTSAFGTRPTAARPGRRCRTGCPTRRCSTCRSTRRSGCCGPPPTGAGLRGARLTLGRAGSMADIFISYAAGRAAINRSSARRSTPPRRPPTVVVSLRELDLVIPRPTSIGCRSERRNVDAGRFDLTSRRGSRARSRCRRVLDRGRRLTSSQRDPGRVWRREIRRCAGSS